MHVVSPKEGPLDLMIQLVRHGFDSPFIDSMGQLFMAARLLLKEEDVSKLLHATIVFHHELAQGRCAAA